MGKGNRERLRKANSEASSSSVFAPKKQKKETPMWVWTLVTVLIVALILSGVVYSFIYENGYLLRWTTVVESENYEVDAAMLSYYYYNYYNTFLSYYGSYASYIGLDTSTSLKDQEMEEGVTWFEYFMESALDEAEKLVVYCNEADARGIELDDSDNEQIESVLQTIRDSRTSYNSTYSSSLTLNAFISMTYGTGVKMSDIRRALELTQLASKCSETISDEILAGISDEDITGYYGDNETDFWTASILSHTFTAAATSTDEGYDYEAEKAKIEELAAGLLECKTEESFREYVAKLTAEDSFDSSYAEYAEDYDDSVLPDAEALAAYRASIVEQAVKDATEGNTVEETESEDELEQMLNQIAIDVTAEVTTVLDALLDDAYAYETETDAGKWISDSSRKAGDITSIETTDDTSHTVAVYLMLTPMHRDDEMARNVGHILFTEDTYGTSEEAQAKAEEILEEYLAGDKTRESFEALGKEYTEDSGVFYEDVIRGAMVEEFEDWLFDPERKDGDTDVIETSYGFHVMYYDGVSDMPAWKVEVRDALISERSETLYNELIEKYGVKTIEGAEYKVNA